MFAQPKTSFLKKIIACVCALAFATSLMPRTALAASAQQAATGDAALVAQAAGSPSVTYRSERDIKNYYREHNVDLTQVAKFCTTPQGDEPLHAWRGRRQLSLAQAIITLNFIR